MHSRRNNARFSRVFHQKSRLRPISMLIAAVIRNVHSTSYRTNGLRWIPNYIRNRNNDFETRIIISPADLYPPLEYLTRHDNRVDIEYVENQQLLPINGTLVLFCFVLFFCFVFYNKIESAFEQFHDETRVGYISRPSRFVTRVKIVCYTRFFFLFLITKQLTFRNSVRLTTIARRTEQANVVRVRVARRPLCEYTWRDSRRNNNSFNEEHYY